MQILRKKLTNAGIAGALVLGVGALAGVATAGGSDSPAPASRPSTDDSVGNTVGSVPSTEVTSPTLGVTTPTGGVGVTTPTLDDHGGDRDGDDNDNSGPGHGGDDDSGHGGDDDRSGSNSGPG